MVIRSSVRVPQITTFSWTTRMRPLKRQLHVDRAFMHVPAVLRLKLEPVSRRVGLLGMKPTQRRTESCGIVIPG
jgi:hypothetical protein